MKTLQQVKYEHIKEVLEHTKGVINSACEILDVSPRFVYRFIEKYPELKERRDTGYVHNSTLVAKIKKDPYKYRTCEDCDRTFHMNNKQGKLRSCCYYCHSKNIKMYKC